MFCTTLGVEIDPAAEVMARRRRVLFVASSCLLCSALSVVCTLKHRIRSIDMTLFPGTFVPAARRWSIDGDERMLKSLPTFNFSPNPPQMIDPQVLILILRDEDLSVLSGKTERSQSR